MNPRDNDMRSRTTIIECLEDFEGQMEREPDHIKFKYKVGETIVEEFVAYNGMCNFIEDTVQNENETWHLCKVLDHHSVRTSQRKNHQVLP